MGSNRRKKRKRRMRRRLLVTGTGEERERIHELLSIFLWLRGYKRRRRTHIAIGHWDATITSKI